MASNFPTSIDTFTNPVFTKVNGVDVVNASHVNDLQDAIRSVQEVVAGTGKPLDMDSNNFIADNTSFKVMVEALDSALGGIGDGLAEHKAFVLITDPTQHHSNVIEVTAIGNLSSSRVQTALEEHQVDIDNMMSGGLVEGATLDDRYVPKAGAQSMQGPLTITEDLIVNGDTTLGDALGDTVVVFDAMTVGGALDVVGDVTVDADILVQAGQKIAEEGATSDSYIMFGADKIEVYTHKDFIVRLDADDATDGQADDGEFQIRNGLDALVLSVDESGNVVSSGDVMADTVTITTNAAVGSMILTDDKFDLTMNELHLQLDSGNGAIGERFFITMNGDTGANLASADLLMNLDENSTLIAGVHVLKSGVQETGYFGLKVLSSNAGGEFHGMGVNFKHQLTNSPSSVTLTPDVGSINHSNLSVTDMNQYGFFFEFDTPAVGATKVFGTYTTIGN